MRPFALPLAAALVVAAASANADVGPPPQCGQGAHSEYFQGRHCVPDGSHIDPSTGQVVKDGAPAPTTSASAAPTASATATAAPTDTAPAPTAAPTPTTAPTQVAAPSVPSTPPGKAGCGCVMAGAAPVGGATAAWGALACLLLVTSSRRSRR